MAIPAVLSLTNVVSSTIQPAEKTEHVAVIEPSVFDFIILDIYTPVVFFYKPDNPLTANPQKLVARLKESLSAVLVPYFPFAGRWVKTHDFRQRELRCNDEGVPFIEAFIDADMESAFKTTTMEFEATDQLRGFWFLGFDPKRFNQDVNSPVPLLLVQVTLFKCGGVALSVTFSHMATDGKGFFDFLKAWSEIALHGHTSIVPTHDRSWIKTYTAIEYEAFLKSCFAKSTQAPPQTVRPPFFEKVFHLKRKAVEEIKQEAIQKNMGPITTLDIISAHFWRSVSDFLKSSGDKISQIPVDTAVEGRKRFNVPPLPEFYSGNVVCRGSFPNIPPAEIATKTMLEVAQIVHEAVRAVDQSTARDFVEGIMNFYKMENKDFSTEAALGMTMNVTSWFRFPIYEVDFGEGYGCPILAAPNFGCDSNSFFVVTVLPPPPAVSKYVAASVHILLPEPDLCALKENLMLPHSNFLSLFYDKDHRFVI